MSNIVPSGVIRIGIRIILLWPAGNTIVNISVCNALSIGSGLVAAAFLRRKRGRYFIRGAISGGFL